MSASNASSTSVEVLILSEPTSIRRISHVLMNCAGRLFEKPESQSLGLENSVWNATGKNLGSVVGRTLRRYFTLGSKTLFAPEIVLVCGDVFHIYYDLHSLILIHNPRIYDLKGFLRIYL